MLSETVRNTLFCKTHLALFSRGQNSAFLQPLSFFLLLFWAHTNAHMHSNPFQQQDVGQVKTSLHGAFWVSSVPSVTLCWSLSHIRGWLLDAKQQLLSKLCFCFSAILLVSNTFVKLSTDCLLANSLALHWHDSQLGLTLISEKALKWHWSFFIKNMHKSKTFSDVLDQMYVRMFHIPSQTLFFVLGEKKRSLGRDYHPLCLKCQKCMRTLTAGQHAEVDKMAFKYKNWEQMGWMGEWENAISTVCMFQHDEKPYCSHCYLRMFCSKGTACSNALIYMQVPPERLTWACESLSTGTWWPVSAQQLSPGLHQQHWPQPRWTNAGKQKTHRGRKRLDCWLNK